MTFGKKFTDEFQRQATPDVFFPCLLDILNRNEPDFEATCQELNFNKEISFVEFLSSGIIGFIRKRLMFSLPKTSFKNRKTKFSIIRFQ